MIGSAWRCTILQTPLSGRKMLVVRRATGKSRSLPLNFTLKRST